MTSATRARWIASHDDWPIVVARVLPGMDDEPPDISSFYVVAEEILAKREPCVVIGDITHARPDASRRKLVAEWVRENAARIDRYVVTIAVVTPSSVQRGLLVAIKWLVAGDRNIRPFSTHTEAMRWAREQVEKIRSVA